MLTFNDHNANYKLIMLTVDHKFTYIILHYRCRQKFMNDFKTLLFIHLKERGHIISVKILKSMPFLNWFCGSSQTVPPFSTMPVSLKELKEFYCAALSNLPNVSTLSIRYINYYCDLKIDINFYNYYNYFARN